MTGGLRGIAASGEGALRAVRKFRAEEHLLVPQSAMTMIRYLIIFGHFGWCMAGARFEMLDSGRFVGLH